MSEILVLDPEEKGVFIFKIKGTRLLEMKRVGHLEENASNKKEGRNAK